MMVSQNSILTLMIDHSKLFDRPTKKGANCHTPVLTEKMCSYQIYYRPRHIYIIIVYKHM